MDNNETQQPEAKPTILVPCPICKGRGFIVTAILPPMSSDCGYCESSGKVDPSKVQAEIVNGDYAKRVDEAEKKIKSLESGLEITLPHLTNRIIELEAQYKDLAEQHIALYHSAHTRMDNISEEITELRQQLEVRSKTLPQQCTGKLDCTCSGCTEHWSKTPLPRTSLKATKGNPITITEIIHQYSTEESVTYRIVDTGDNAQDRITVFSNAMHVEHGEGWVYITPEDMDQIAREWQAYRSEGVAQPEPTNRTCMISSCEEPAQPTVFRSVLIDVQSRIDAIITEDEDVGFDLTEINEVIRNALEVCQRCTGPDPDEEV